MKRTLLALTLCIICLACGKAQNEQKEQAKQTLTGTVYLASTGEDIELYSVTPKEGVNIYEGAILLPRGTQLYTTDNECVRVGKQEYMPVAWNEKTYYIEEEKLVASLQETVREKTLFVRTPASVIDDLTTVHIAGQALQGDRLEILGFDTIINGAVKRYKVRLPNKTEGYVFGKYLVENEALAAERYQPEYYDSIFALVKNTFGGGEAIGCDYWPREKPKFANNPMPEVCYSLYLNFSAGVIGKIDEYIALAKQTKINTFVLDIKDCECPGWKSETFQEMSPTNYARANKGHENLYDYAVRRLHEEGFYVVARITCFKDTYFVRDNPQCAISEKSTGNPFYHNKAYWPSAYDRSVWQFNVRLAKEAVRRFGFNEVNFDYVRFPDRMQSVANLIDYHNTYNESKVQAIQRFVQYAVDELHEDSVYVSIDVFGESANKGYTTPYGQFWPAISNVADVMSGMPYPDHFAAGYGGYKDPWNHPYHTMKTWGNAVQSRQAETPSPAIVRTWIQAYHVLRYVDPNGIDYNAANMEQEIRGLFDTGCTGGYVTWLSNSSLERYKSQKEAFKIDYLKETKQAE